MSYQPATILPLIATAVSQILVVTEPGPSAGIAVILYLLFIPGFAATAHMGPMDLEPRLLIATAASIVIGAMVSGALLLAGLWSPIAGFEVIAGFTLLSAVISMRGADGVGPDRLGSQITGRPT